jgi:hypothetical protein
MIPCVIRSVALLGLVAGPSDGAPPGFVLLAGAPTEADMRCTAFGEARYVEVRAGRVEVVESSPRRNAFLGEPSPPPFCVALPGDERPGTGRWTAIRVEDGWFVGRAGEWVGGLYWVDPTGNDPVGMLIPWNPVARFDTDVVNAFERIDGDILVLIGSRLFAQTLMRLRNTREGWSLERVGDVKEPLTYLAAGRDALYVVSIDGSVLECLWGNACREIGRVPQVAMPPASMAIGPDGGVYLGLKRYVLRLAWDPYAWTRSPTWFGPEACVDAAGRPRCACSYR